MSEVEEISKHLEKPKRMGPSKRGRLHKRGARRKNWLERTFVLENNELYYIKSDSDTKRQGEVPLDANWSVQKWDIDNRKFAFIIQNPYGGRSFYCDAPNNQVREEWIEAISQTIACIGGAGMFDDLEEEKRTSSAEDSSTSINTEAITLPTGKDKVGLGDFELKAVLGKGSFGKVMLVQKHDTKEVFAMKVLRKEAIIAGNQVQHTKAERSILQEVDCPFIVRLHYAFQTQGKLYLILDYVRGGELFFQLKREGLFSEERVRLYSAEIILALQHLHDKNIVYRDLKPENLLLDVEGHIMLTDFGLSKEAVVRKNGARTFCGTPEYLAPEILKGIGHGKAVDWWSLGTLMYEMLTGLPPFYSQNRKVMFERILKAELTFPSHIKPEARHLLSALLSRDPATNGPVGAVFNISASYKLSKTSGTGQVLIWVVAPQDGFEFGWANNIYSQPPGVYPVTEAFSSAPTEEIPFYDGVYTVFIQVCEGTCGGTHSHEYQIAIGANIFNMTN